MFGIGVRVRSFAPTMRLAIAAAVVLAAITFAFGYAELVVGKVADRVFQRPVDVSPRAVILVPGAGLTDDGRPGYYLTQRLTCALDAFEQGKAPHILVSGDHGQVGYDEPSAMARWLVEHGVPDTAITRDFAGFRTRDTMERARRVFGVTSALVCTQGLHARRTAFLAVAAGLDAAVVVAAGDRFLGLGPRLRERVAVLGAVFDVWVGREPRFLGEPERIGGR